MDQKQLEEYEAQEHAHFDRHVRRASEGKKSDYPANRFTKLSYPIAKRANHCSLWAQVPLFGSLIIPIFPVEESRFRRIHGFHWKELPKLVEFWKETGRIQFVLGATPTLFRGLDYLDSLLEEKPPTVYGNFRYQGINQRLFSKWEAEFETASKAVYAPYFLATYDRGGFTVDEAYSRFRDMELCYMWLRANGLDDLADAILEDMAVDPVKADAILYFYRAYVVVPALEPMRTITNVSYEDFRTFRSIGGKAIPVKDLLFPAEIGAFLLRKLTPVPEGFESCKALTERFQNAELQNLVQKLSLSISTSDVDLARSGAKDVGEVLDKIWVDSGRFGNKIKGVSYGVELSISAAGYMGAQMLAAGPFASLGLLAGLGFHLLDKSTGAVSKRAGSKVARWGQKSYTLALFDFRKKHSLFGSL